MLVTLFIHFALLTRVAFLKRFLPSPAVCVCNKAKHALSSLVQDGYFCIKRCHPTDAVCKANFTQSISYQFAALPTLLKDFRDPIEVSKVTAESLDKSPFYVKYEVDKKNEATFMVEQSAKVGILKLKKPIKGPQSILVRLHMNVHGRNHVLIANNLALIQVYVSQYSF